MSTAYWLQGDTRTVLADLAEAGVVVDVVITSPPFLNLRSYLPAGDPAKAFEIGSETDPGQFIDTLLDVTEACERVLAPHGSIAVELGDTYAGSGGAGGDYVEGGLRDGQPSFTGSAKARRAGEYPIRDDYPRPPRTRPDGNGRAFRGGERLPDCKGDGWPTEKSLSLIPESYRWALAYGRNPFTGRPTPRWRIRNTVTWVRPNPPVGRDGDKFRPATSDIVIACRTDEAGRRRYWDGDAVRTPVSANSHGGGTWTTHGGDQANTGTPKTLANPAGAPLLDWWKLSGAGYDGAHYATFPPKLVEPLIKAMCPERVCTVCGEPSRRILGEATYERTDSRRVPARLTMRDGERPAEGVNQFTRPDGANTSVVRHVETLGWTSCGHDAWRPGIVLDPFAGSGTTGAVATGHGRDAILIDLDRKNVELARDRVGPLFFTETTVAELANVLGPRAQSGSAA